MAVSVLMPVRDAVSTLDEAIGSTLADLRGARFELVLVDDGSTDGSREKARAWAASDPAVRVFERGAEGIVAALNAGLAECRFPLVARMDADDVWLPGRWAAQSEALEADPKLAAVGGRVEIFGEPARDGMKRYEAWLNARRSADEVWRERYVESPLVHPAALARREVLLEVGGYREGAFPEDYELWLRLLARGHRLANVGEPVLRWRDSGKRLTRTDPRYGLEAHAALKADFLKRDPIVHGGVRIAGAGPTGLRLARALRSRGVAVTGFIEVHPRKIGTAIEGIPIAGYEALEKVNGPHLLVAIGSPGARAEVRGFLQPRGWLEGRDFTFVA